MDLNLFNIVVFSFLIGVFSSILGAGPVTLLVFRNALLGNYIKSFSLVLGAAIMESVYCFLSLSIVDYYFYNEFFQVATRFLSVMVFFFIGIYLFRTNLIEDHEIDIKKYRANNFLSSFLIGFGLVALNPTIILTWSAASAILISFKIIEIVAMPDIVFFTAFAFVGNVSGGLLLVLFTKKFSSFFSKKSILSLFKIIGVIVISISVYFIFDFVLLYVF